MAENSDNIDISKMTFEEAFKELETVVKQLEKGGENLNQAIQLYEKGSQLRKHCEERLGSAKMQIEKVVKDSEGKATLEEFNLKDS